MQREPVGPGQESVWDYPRPPALESVDVTLRAMAGRDVLAETDAGWRVLETSHPPVYYFPAEDVRTDWLHPAGRSFCEWKGEARSYDLVGPMQVPRIAWSYPDPAPKYAAIAGMFAFYADRAGACFVGDEEVRPQPGGFYGGWITSDIRGPFKGIPGSQGW